MTAPIVQVRDATLGYRGRPVLERVSLEIERGEYVALVGPNGAGKTTLLRCLLGLLPALSGKLVYGTDRKRKPWAYVPQRDALEAVFPLCVMDVVLMGVYWRIPPLVAIGRRRRRVAAECLDRVGLARVAKQPFHSLSGGQRQRVLIARALAVESDVMALDEPTAGVDRDAERTINDLITDLNRTSGLTVVIATHHLHVIQSSVHSAIWVDGGQAIRRPVESVIEQMQRTALV